MRGVYLSLSTIVVTIYFSLIARSFPPFFLLLHGVLPLYHCTECSSFVITRSAPFLLSLRGVPKARRSNLPHPVIARKDASPSEAISLFPYFWNSHPIVNQLPEIASRHYRAPRNDKRAGCRSHRDCHVASLLAVTNLGAQRERDTQRFLGTPNHRAVLCNDLPFPVIARSAVRPPAPPSLRGVPQARRSNHSFSVFLNLYL